MTMTDEKIQKLEARINELSKDRLMLMKKVEELESDFDNLFGVADRLEKLIALWNEKHPNDQIFTHRKRPMSDYTMTDQEWKEATRVPHPREWKKKFDPSTGEFQ